MSEGFSFEQLCYNERPTLKAVLPLETYRLLRISGMKEIFGDSTGAVLYRLGKILTSHFVIKSEDEFLGLIKKLGIGVPKIISKTEDNVVVELYECMTCAGLPITGELICNFECGFIAGGFEMITNRKTKGFQTKSWTNGDGFCEFVVDFF